MSMRDINNTRLTICEVLRCINDRLQGEKYVDERDMLALAEQMAKRMINKLVEYNQMHQKDFWDKNPQYLEKINRSMEKYLAGDAERARMLLQSEHNSRGIVMIAFGEDYDAVAAQTVAMSRKNILCPITILTNLKKRSPVWKQSRNINFVELDIPTNENRRVKIELYKYSPYNETIYVDCDSVIKHGGIEKLFDLLSDNNFVFQLYGVWRENNRYFKIYRDTVKSLGVKLPLNIIVGGFWAFKKCKEMELLSAQWLENWEKTGRGRDMPSLACAIQKTGIKHIAITKEHGFFSVDINDSTIVVHRKRTSDMIRLGIRGYVPNKPFDKNFHNDWELVYMDDKDIVSESPEDAAIMSHPWVLKKYENNTRKVRIKKYVETYLPEILKGGIKFLDIATGPGEVMEIANRSGCKSVGIEVDFPTKDKTNEHVRIKYIRIMHTRRRLDIVYGDFNGMMEYGDMRFAGKMFDAINCQDAINLIAGVNDPLGLDDPMSVCIKKPEDRLFEITRDKDNLYHNDGLWIFSIKYTEYFNLFYSWCRSHLNNNGILMISALWAKNYEENSAKMIRIAESNGFKLEKCDRFLSHRFRAI